MECGRNGTYVQLTRSYTHNTSQSGSAEFESTVEARLKLFRVVALDKGGELLLGGRIRVLFEPSFGLGEEIG